jgi:hypothetical protein
MSSATLSSSPAASSTINEQLRLRITEELAGSFKGDISGPDHADYERQLRHRHPVHRPGLRLRPDDAHRGLGLRAGAGGRRAARVRPRRAHPAAQRRLARRAQARHAGLPFVPLEYVGKRLLMLVSMWLDDAEDAAGAELIARLTETGQPCIKTTTVLPFAAGVQRLIDVEFEDGHRYYTKEAHVADLADDAVDKLDAFWRHDMPMEGEVEIIGLGGAIGDVAEADSAFSNRGYLLWLNFAMRAGTTPPTTRTTSLVPVTPWPAWPRGPAAASTSTCSTSMSRTVWSRRSAARRSTSSWPGSRPGTTRRTCSG